MDVPISSKPTNRPLARVAKMEPSIKDNRSIPVMKGLIGISSTTPQTFEQERQDLSNAVRVASIILDLEVKRVFGRLLNRTDLQKFFITMHRKVMELKVKEDERMAISCKSRNGQDAIKEENRVKHCSNARIVFLHEVNSAIARTVETFDGIKARFDTDNNQNTFKTDVYKLIRRYCEDLKDAIYPDCEIFDELDGFRHGYGIHHQSCGVNHYYPPENFDKIGALASTPPQIQMRLKRQQDFLRKLLYKNNFSGFTELVRNVPMVMPYIILIDERRRELGPMIIPENCLSENVGTYVEQNAPGYRYKLRD